MDNQDSLLLWTFEDAVEHCPIYDDGGTVGAPRVPTPLHWALGSVLCMGSAARDSLRLSHRCLRGKLWARSEQGR